MRKVDAAKKHELHEKLVSLATYLSFGQDLQDDQLLRLIMEIGIGMMHADEGSLLLLDREKEELEFMMTIGPEESGKTLKRQRFSMHQGITGLAASTGEPQTGSPSYHGIKQPDRGEGQLKELTAVLAAPMLVGDEVVGVITAISFQKGRTFSTNDVQLYCKFANLCGNVVRQRFRESIVRSVLLGDETQKSVPEIQRLLSSHGLTSSDKAVAEIAKNLGQLSVGREDVLPICSELVKNIVQITKSLGWKVK